MDRWKSDKQSVEGFFFQDNNNFQTILLVSIASKLFRKLTSRVSKTQVHCSNSSIKNSIYMKIHVDRLKFHKRKPRNQNLKHNMGSSDGDQAWYDRPLLPYTFLANFGDRSRPRVKINNKNEETHPKTPIAWFQSLPSPPEFDLSSVLFLSSWFRFC